MKPPATSSSHGHSTVAARLDKHFATLRARAALLGATLHRIENDRGRDVFVVTRWAFTRELADLAAVERWLHRVEGRSA